MALPGKRRSALVFKQKFDLILVLRLSEVSIREHNLSSNDSAAASRYHLNSPPGKKWSCNLFSGFHVRNRFTQLELGIMIFCCWWLNMKAELVNFFLNLYSFFLVLNWATTSEIESNSSNFKWDPRGYVFYCPCMGKKLYNFYSLILLIIKLWRT